MHAAETIYTEAEARNILRTHVPPGETWEAHCETVARLAGQIADALQAAGVAVKPALARTGGLLHDIGRSVTHHGTRHCWEGRQMLLAWGQPTLARFCVTHSYAGMTAAEAVLVGWPADDYRPRTWEEKAVTIGDGLTHGDRVVLSRDRTADVLERYRAVSTPTEYALLLAVTGKMRALMVEVEAIIGQPVETLCDARPLHEG